MHLHRRTLLAATLGAAMSLSLATIASAQDGKLDIAFLTPTFDISDAFERTYWAMRAVLDENDIDYEVSLHAVQAGDNHPEQLAQIEAVIARGVDYVVIAPTEFEAVIPGLRQLKAAGIPTVVYNYLTPHEDEDVRALRYIGFDHAEGGRLAGSWAAVALNGRGKVAILQGTPGVVSDQRRDGFISVVEQFPNIEVLVDVYAEWDRVKAFHATENIMAAHPDVALVYGVSTTIGLGAAQAIRQAGLTDQIKSMGFGGTGDEITAMQEGWLSSSPLRSIDDGGVAAAEAIIQHLNGEEVSVSWGGPFIMVDQDSDFESLLEYSVRFSRPVMGR